MPGFRNRWYSMFGCVVRRLWLSCHCGCAGVARVQCLTHLRSCIGEGCRPVNRQVHVACWLSSPASMQYMLLVVVMWAVFFLVLRMGAIFYFVNGCSIFFFPSRKNRYTLQIVWISYVYINLLISSVPKRLISPSPPYIFLTIASLMEYRHAHDRPQRRSTLPSHSF